VDCFFRLLAAPLLTMTHLLTRFFFGPRGRESPSCDDFFFAFLASLVCFFSGIYLLERLDGRRVDGSSIYFNFCFFFDSVRLGFGGMFSYNNLGHLSPGWCIKKLSLWSSKEFAQCNSLAYALHFAMNGAIIHNFPVSLVRPAYAK
jgi:hypothetical protein